MIKAYVNLRFPFMIATCTRLDLTVTYFI